MLTLPVLVLVDCMYSMPGVPFTCSSMGMATVCSTVCASAPVYAPEIPTEGGVIFGYWSIARLSIQIIPEMIRTREITIAVTGLFMKVLAIMPAPVYSDHGIAVYQIPVPDRYPAVPLFFLSPSAYRDAPLGSRVVFFRRTVW